MDKPKERETEGKSSSPTQPTPRHRRTRPASIQPVEDSHVFAVPTGFPLRKRVRFGNDTKSHDGLSGQSSSTSSRRNQDQDVFVDAEEDVFVDAEDKAFDIPSAPSQQVSPLKKRARFEERQGSSPTSSSRSLVSEQRQSQGTPSAGSSSEATSSSRDMENRLQFVDELIQFKSQLKTCLNFVCPPVPEQFLEGEMLISSAESAILENKHTNLKDWFATKLQSDTFVQAAIKRLGKFYKLSSTMNKTPRTQELRTQYEHALYGSQLIESALIQATCQGVSIQELVENAATAMNLRKRPAPEVRSAPEFHPAPEVGPAPEVRQPRRCSIS